MIKWVGKAETRPLVFARKKDNPQPNHYWARRVDFGIHGWSWCAFAHGGTKVLMPNGKDGTIHEARLHNSGHVVGLRDLTACDHYSDQALKREWRGSLVDRIHRELEAANERMENRDG